MSLYKTRLASYQLILACALSVIGFVALALYREKPRQLASPSSVIQRADLKHSFALLKENRFILLAVLPLAMVFSVAYAYSIIIGSAFQEYGATSM